MCNVPERFRNTIVEYAIVHVQPSVLHLKPIILRFKKRYKISKMNVKEVEEAFKWLASKICAAYNVQKPKKITVYQGSALSNAPWVNTATGEIYTNKSIISFLHELGHWIFRDRSEFFIQAWAIAVYLLAYCHMLPKLELVNDFYLVLRK